MRKSFTQPIHFQVFLHRVNSQTSNIGEQLQGQTQQRIQTTIHITQANQTRTTRIAIRTAQTVKESKRSRVLVTLIRMEELSK
jgi:hypothetical protein